MNHELRPYQTDCIDRILEDEHETTLANLFCGLGKSLIMAELLFRRFNEGIQFVVMPNLSLVRQFCANYLEKRGARYMVFCSLEDTDGVNEATTDEAEAIKFVQGGDGVIATTYQSLEKLVRSVEGQVVSCAIFDESHHLQRENNEWALTCPAFQRRLLFSATPSPNNGVPVFTYSYAEALTNVNEETGEDEPYSQDLRVRIGMYDNSDTEGKRHDNIELLVTTALLTGNMRCLTFHNKVNGDDPDFVINFAGRCEEQIPRLIPAGMKWTVRSMHSNTLMTDRAVYLKELDETPEGELYIICSCETLSEGVDTKRCNLVGFIHAVKGYAKILQKLGRAARKQLHDRPSTILLPFFVDKSVLPDEATKEQVDAFIRTAYPQGNPVFDFFAAIHEGDPELLDTIKEIYKGPQKPRLEHYEKVCGGLPRFTLEEAVEQVTRIRTDDVAAAAEESQQSIEVHPRDGPVEQYEGGAEVKASLIEMEPERYIVKKGHVTEAQRENRITIFAPSPFLMSFSTGESLNSAMVEYETRMEHFDQGLETVKAFHTKHGVPRHRGTLPNEQYAASWIISRRQEKKNKKLAPERIARIEEEFADWWSWNPLVDYVERMLLGCKDFFDKHGFSPKKNGEHEGEIELADWIGRIRERYKHGKNMALCNRIENLFPWWIWVVRDEMHEERIEQLHEFLKTFKEMPKFHGPRKNEASLASWVNGRRDDKRENRNPELCKRMEDEFKDFWVWEPKDSKVEKWISELQQFDSIYHEGPKNGGDRENEDRLARWIDTLRQDVKNEKRLELWHRLQQMFKWWSIDPWGDYHRDNLKKLKAFRAKHQKLPTARGTLENEKELARWLTKIRTLYRDGKSSDITDLVRKECPWFSWDPKKDLFEKKVKEAKEFISKFKSLPRTGGKRENEKELASWMNNLRATNNRQKLDESIRLRISQDIPSFDWYPSTHPLISTTHSIASSMDEDTASITEDGADASLDSLEFAPTAEQDPPEERLPREKRPRDDGLDGMDKDALIAMIRDKRGREGGGYTAPNPVNKDEINALFSRLLPRHRGAVLFLDHTDFKTARALQATGVEPRDMIIPQRDRATYDAMRRDPVFGPSVILGDFNSILSQHTMPVRGIYADFTGPLKEAEAFIEACRRIDFVPHAVVAVTITLRNPEGGAEHVNQDIVKLSGMLNRELDTIAIDDPETGKTIWSLAYGNGAPMATVIQRRRN